MKSLKKQLEQMNPNCEITIPLSFLVLTLAETDEDRHAFELLGGFNESGAVVIRSPHYKSQN
jgi:hypothetical protein